MGELVGALFFGWIWVTVARVLLWPFSPATTRAWLIPVTVVLVIVLFSFSVADGAIDRLSPVGIALSLLSLVIFVYRAHRQNSREAEAEAEAEAEGDEDNAENDAPAPSPKTVSKNVSKTKPRRQKPSARTDATTPPRSATNEREVSAPASSDSTFEGVTDSGTRWHVDLEAMTLTFGGDTHRLRRTNEETWETRQRGEPWQNLEELDDHLPTVVDTRWRRFVRAGA